MLIFNYALFRWENKEENYMDKKFYDLLEANPVIAGIKDMDGLHACCPVEEIKVVFILFGDICNISNIVKQVKDAKKIAMVHRDLITGLSSKDVAVDYIKENTLADGIISTRSALIKRANELSMYTTLRVFVLDSMAFDNIKHQMAIAKPDIIEILPGLMPKVISMVCRLVKVPVIAGGLISQKEDVVAALSAGAISVSTTNPKVWLM